MTPRELAVEEARTAGFAAELRDGIPFISEESVPTFERKRDLIRWISTAAHIGGARILHEGVVLEPPRPPAPEELGWPYTEPEIMERYGIEAPGG